MAWEHLSVTKPHLVYIILGGFTSIFMLVSSVIKERAYIGEATVATLCGVIFGPHAANLINPLEWGNVDIVTIEFSRIVLVVQCFAVGVELPKFYMEKHWKSVVYLLVPVMTFGWLVTSLFIWWMVPPLNWLDSLVVAACVTATDPVLASSVVGKGKFAKRVPKHLRDLLSAESGCNDGMAFPFIYLSLYLIEYNRKTGPVSFHFTCYTILYECIFGAFFGFTVGYLARHAIKYAENRDFIDRESLLAFYFVLGLFCAGSGSIIGVDDLLVGFSAGVGFSNDGWFAEKTEESHVSNVIDLLLNLSYFVYLGTIIPWEMYNNAAIGLTAWRLCIIAIFVILFRRIPIMLALKPLIPDVKTWREALFAGHFGPIGVGAIFVALLARGELQGNGAVPLSTLPDREGEFAKHYDLMLLVWPIVTFLVIASMVVHGSSVAVFTLGKNITTMRLTLSYTAALEDGPSWMNRLPRISSQSKSQARTMSDTEGEELKMPEMPPGTLPPVGIPRNFLRRQKEEASSRNGSRASSLVSRRRKVKKWDEGIGPGGPIEASAIRPVRPTESTLTSPAPVDEKEQLPFTDSQSSTPDSPKEKGPEIVESRDIPSPRGRRGLAPEVNIYDEGDNLIIENQDGDVLHVVPPPGSLSPARTRSRSRSRSRERSPSPGTRLEAPGQQTTGRARSKSDPSAKFDWTVDGIKKKCVEIYYQEVDKRKEKTKEDRKHEAACAYQFGNTVSSYFGHRVSTSG